MPDERSTSDLRKRMSEIKKGHPKSRAIALITDMLEDEYKRLEGVMKCARDCYLNMNVDDPSQQNDIADLRLDAVEKYQPAYVIENFMAGIGVDITPLIPQYEGSFELSSYKDGERSLSVVSLRENAMRTLGGHCNVIGDVVVLEKLLYDHTYLAAVMKLTDDYEPGKQSYVEFDYYTVVFDEDIQSIVKVPLRGR